MANPIRVLITGATGQVGSATARRLRSCATVVATDHARLDLSRPDAIPSVLDDISPNLVINAAGYTAVDRAEEEPALALLVNADSPGAMARWCARNDVPFIQFSTDYVFDGQGTRPWSEDDPPRPLSVYGASKLAGEEQVRAAGGSFLIFRTSWVYSAHGTNFLRTIAKLAQIHSELRIVADQIGAPTSAAIIAESVSAILARGFEELRDKAREAGGVVHLAASGETNWHAFAQEIVEGLRARGVPLYAERIIPIRTEDYHLPAQRPLNSRLNLQRLQALFGITPQHWREPLQCELDQLTKEIDLVNTGHRSSQ